MRRKAYVVLNAVVLIAFVAMCLLTAFQLSKSNDLTGEIENLKKSTALVSQTNQLQQSISDQQQIHTQLAAQIDQLQSTYSDIQTTVTKVQQNRKTSVTGKVAYLTFDDGPSSLTPHVLDILKQNNIHATFFVIGKYASQNPDMVKRTFNEGHVIGNHSWSHDYETIYPSDTAFLNDFNKTQTYLTNLLGVAPQVCRFPGGTNNTVSQKYSAHIMKVIDKDIKGLGIKPFDWNAYAGDADKGPKPSPEEIVNNVMKNARSYKNPVILFHDTSVNENDLKALPIIIQQLRDAGYSFGVLTPQSPDCQYSPV